MQKIVFICQKNGGKSQMAAAVMRKHAGASAEIYSAGTKVGTELNQESVTALTARGYSVEGEYPKALSPEMLEDALAIFLGEEAQVESLTTGYERWITVEPSKQGIKGAERMNLILDDIEKRVFDLIKRLELDR